MMNVLQQMHDGGHEEVVFARDGAVGLTAIIAIHSTALGPALGGTRMYPYATEAQALRDALELSRGMTYKAAAAGLDLGGGKAVIIGDPRTDKKESLFRAFGRFVDRMNGLFYTGEDVGTDHVGHGPRSEGDPVCWRRVARAWWRRRSVTGHCLRRAARHESVRGRALGPDSLHGRRVAVQGLGKVGWHLTELLQQADAIVIGCDVNDDQRERAHSNSAFKP